MEDKRMVRCASGVTCKHADFDINEISDEWRQRQVCGPCLFAEIDRRALTGAVSDSLKWLHENGGRQRAAYFKGGHGDES